MVLGYFGRMWLLKIISWNKGYFGRFRVAEENRPIFGGQELLAANGNNSRWQI
jgi:hypothetical protein